MPSGRNIYHNCAAFFNPESECTAVPISAAAKTSLLRSWCQPFAFLSKFFFFFKSRFLLGVFSLPPTIAVVFWFFYAFSLPIHCRRFIIRKLFASSSSCCCYYCCCRCCYCLLSAVPVFFFFYATTDALSKFVFFIPPVSWNQN